MTRNTIMTELLNRTSPMDAGPFDDTARYLEGEDSQEVHGVKLVPIMGADIIRPLFVIVEGYDKKQHGRVKRRWLAEFTDAERKVVSAWYARLYTYYLRSGIPNTGVRMNLTTLATLRKAASFFAEVP